MSDSGEIIEPSDVDLHEPWNWQASLENETEAEISEKFSRAIELGVPAVLFTKAEVDTRIGQLASLESQRYEDDEYRNVLYVVIEHGGWPLADGLFPDVESATEDHIVRRDSIAVDSRNFGRSGLRITKPLTDGTKLSDRDVVLIDVAIRSGTTLQALKAAFLDRSWTVKKNLGSAAKSVTARAVTRREGVELPTIDFADIDAAFITPYGVHTAGKGGDDKDGSRRNQPDIFIGRKQNWINRDHVASALEILGDRVYLSIDDIDWVKE